MSKPRLPEGSDAGSAVRARDYLPQDRMFLFWLQDPAAPVLVGSLDLSPRLRGGVFQYAEHWLRAGYSLSPDLPLRPGEFLSEPDHLPGAIDDARPDRWGERVIRHIEAPRRLSILEYLFFAGDDRFGALGVSLDPGHYRPCAGGPLPHVGEVPAIYELAPAFDMLPMCRNLGYQQMGVGEKGSESSLENAMSAHRAFRLSSQQAQAEISAVARVVDGWRAHFERAGVRARDIELLSASIDRHFLAEQRKWALRLGD